MTRYIDADELLARLKSDALWKLIVRYNIEGAIEALPTADVAQVRHGKWISGNPICPCCGGDKFKDLDADIWADWQPKYCPNCGARMDAERREE